MLPNKSLEELISLKVTRPSELIEDVLPTPGAVLIVGAKKSGKTVLEIQIGISMAAREPYLWGQCKVNQHGPVLVRRWCAFLCALLTQFPVFTHHLRGVSVAAGMLAGRTATMPKIWQTALAA